LTTHHIHNIFIETSNRSGRECSTDHYGKPFKGGSGKNRFVEVKQWLQVVSYELRPHHNQRTLCQYLADESETNGMRAYIDYIFHSQYVQPFENFALIWQGQHQRSDGRGGFGLRSLSDRTMVVCLEDLSHKTNSTLVLDTVHRVQDFLFNTTDHRPAWSGKLKKLQGGAGEGHSTTSDPDERSRLERIIGQIDETFYDGDIAWLDSIFPC